MAGQQGRQDPTEAALAAARPEPAPGAGDRPGVPGQRLLRRPGRDSARMHLEPLVGVPGVVAHRTMAAKTAYVRPDAMIRRHFTTVHLPEGLAGAAARVRLSGMRRVLPLVLVRLNPGAVKAVAALVILAHLAGGGAVPVRHQAVAGLMRHRLRAPVGMRAVPAALLVAATDTAYREPVLPEVIGPSKPCFGDPPNVRITVATLIWPELEITDGPGPPDGVAPAAARRWSRGTEMFPLSDGMPARRFPVVNVLLIVANFAVFLLYELPHFNAAVYHASFYPCSVDGACQAPEPWGISWITAMFLHGRVGPHPGQHAVPGHLRQERRDAFGPVRYPTPAGPRPGGIPSWNRAGSPGGNTHCWPVRTFAAQQPVPCRVGRLRPRLPDRP